MANVKDEFLNRVVEISTKDLQSRYPERFKPENVEATKAMMKSAASAKYDVAAREITATIESALGNDKYQQDVTQHGVNTANNNVASTARQKVSPMFAEQMLVMNNKEAALSNARDKIELQNEVINAKTELAMLRDIKNNYNIKNEVEEKAAAMVIPKPAEPPLAEANKRSSIFRRSSLLRRSSRSSTISPSETPKTTPAATPTATPEQTPTMPRKGGAGAQNDLLRQALEKSAAKAEPERETRADNTKLWKEIEDLLDDENPLKPSEEEDLHQVYDPREHVDEIVSPTNTATPQQSRRPISQTPPKKALPTPLEGNSPTPPPRKNAEAPIPPPRSGTATPTRQSAAVVAHQGSPRGSNRVSSMMNDPDLRRRLDEAVQKSKAALEGSASKIDMVKK